MARSFSKRGFGKYNVYVVLIKDPDSETGYGLYVGQSYWSPEERFGQHLEGYRASYWVKRWAVRLLPELYEHLCGVSKWEALRLEKELAEAFKEALIFTRGGH